MGEKDVSRWAGSSWSGGKVEGDPSAHVEQAVLQRGLHALHPPPTDRGAVHAVICRKAGHERTTPAHVLLCPERGVEGDRWIHGNAHRGMQVAIMRSDVAHLFAGGQHPVFFGDNLLVDLDLSVENLPPGTRLKVGDALCVVSDEPHMGCHLFRDRFGSDALRLTADDNGKQQRFRGVYLTVIEAGEVSRGSVISVLSRP